MDKQTAQQVAATTSNPRERIASLSKDQKLVQQQDEISNLKQQQLAVADGEEPEYIQGNRDSNAKILASEKDEYVHVFTRITSIGTDQKSFFYEDRVTKVHKRQFDDKVRAGMFLQFDEVRVLHDPRENAPQSYNLKPASEPTAATAMLRNDPNIARRESDLQKREQLMETTIANLKQMEDEMREKLDSIRNLETQARNMTFTGRDKAAQDRAAEQKKTQESTKTQTSTRSTQAENSDFPSLDDDSDDDVQPNQTNQPKEQTPPPPSTSRKR